MNTNQSIITEGNQVPAKKNINKIINNIIKYLGSAILTFVVLILGFSFLITPENFRAPISDHSHIRMQYIYHGQAENFGSTKYQVDYVKDICSGAITESPIHFHDQKDQLVHLHWQGVTGGQILKFYGLNYISGLDGYMGIKMDEFKNFKLVLLPIHSQSLPKPQTKDNLFVYVGSADKYELKDTQKFINQSLETFLNKESTYKRYTSSIETSKVGVAGIFSSISLSAYAHSDETGTTPHTDEELKEVNNLLGDIIIFVQEKEPSSEEIVKRFNNLEPLSKSVCGG